MRIFNLIKNIGIIILIIVLTIITATIFLWLVLAFYYGRIYQIKHPRKNLIKNKKVEDKEKNIIRGV